MFTLLEGSPHPRSLLNGCLAGLALSLLVACADPSPYQSNGQPKPIFTETEAAGIAKATTSVSAGTQFLSNATALTIGGGHGTQIEYLSADGTTDLWYPTNGRTVPGYWKVIDFAPGLPGICFLYGSNTYNPVTREGGGAWECDSPLKEYLSRVTQLIDGDPFRLATGKVPFVLPRGAMTVAGNIQLQAGNAVQQGDLTYRFNIIKQYMLEN